MTPIYDEEGYEMEYFIDWDDDLYGHIYNLDGEPIIWVRRWNNHMAPFENLGTGIMYDSLEWLIANAKETQL